METYEVTPEQALIWRQRERIRFGDGTYTPLPDSWTDSGWFAPRGAPRYPDHYAHISIDKVSMIAFTENDQKGVRDRQTRMNPGKYLTKYFSEWLNKSDIAYLATQMGAEYNDDATLHFAKTADEIEDVYRKGPTSCMDGREDDHAFDSPYHPTRVYAGFDLELAYCRRDSRITARALVWPDKKIHTRIYGDVVRMQRMLENDGYCSGSLHGARITKDMDGDAYIIPYLDGLCGAIDRGTHLELSNGSNTTRTVRLCCSAGQVNGLSEDRSRYHCYDCGDGVDEDDTYSDDDGDRYCRSCWEDTHWLCERSGDWAHNDDPSYEVRVRRNSFGNYITERWNEYTQEHNAFFCDRDEVYYYDRVFDAVEINGETWGPEAVERDAICIDGTWYDKDNAPEPEDEEKPQYSPTVVQPDQHELAGIRHTAPKYEVRAGNINEHPYFIVTDGVPSHFYQTASEAYQALNRIHFEAHTNAINNPVPEEV